MEVLNTGSEHVFGFARRHAGAWMMVLANFSEQRQPVSAHGLGLTQPMTDVLTGRSVHAAGGLSLEPYELLWLTG
jgi:amylosucrase/maltose alpha-D-glucosyltransferase/alpha-amylase